MRLVVACHWTDERNPDALDKVREAFGPLKAPDTQGYAIAYEEGDPVGDEFFAHMKAAHEESVGAPTEEPLP